MTTPPTARPVALRRTARGGAARAFAGEEQLASIDAMPVVPELALAGYDTSNLDTLFVNVASFILPAWGIIVGTIFIFGTIAKVRQVDMASLQAVGAHRMVS